ncbi:MAG: ABC transporter permease [Bryobacteraceae bacterium]
MSIRKFLSRLRTLKNWSRREADLDAEIRFHLEEEIDEQTARGLSPAQARAAASKDLGNPTLVRESTRDAWGWGPLERLAQDVRYALRGMRRNPVFSLTAIITLAAGIGANTTVFTILHNLLLRNLPVREPAGLLRVGMGGFPNDTDGSGPIPSRLLTRIRENQQSFANLSAWAITRLTRDDLGDGTPQLINTAYVSGNGLTDLGLSPQTGRLLRPSDDVRGGPPGGWPVVISNGYWRDAFHSSPDAIGRRFRLSNLEVTIVGVAPPGFRGLWPGTDTELFLPLWFFYAVERREPADSPEKDPWWNVIGRLKPGVSLSQAQAELALHNDTLRSQFLPQSISQQPWSAALHLNTKPAGAGLPTFFGRVYSKPLYLMQGLVAVVLLLCCVNISGLLLSRLHGRRQEFAIRTAIGAGRTRLMRQYLTESSLLATAGAGLGASIAWYGVPLLLPFFRHPNLGVGMFITPDRNILTVTATLAIATTLLFGLTPAWDAGRSQPGELLRTRTSTAARRHWLGRGLILVEVALSFLLVSVAGLLSGSLSRLQEEKTGFSLDHVTIQTPPLHLLNQPAEVRHQLYLRMKERLEQLPGVTSASFTWLTPMTSFQATSSFQAIDNTSEPPSDPKMSFNAVGPGYFRTMETAILDGREFHQGEQDSSVCLLNQSAAAFLFPRQASVVGQYVRLTEQKRFPGNLSCRVIGLAQDAKFANLNEPAPRTLYLPIGVELLRSTNLVFLINAPTKQQAISAYTTAKKEVIPAAPLVLFATLREQMEAALGTQKALSLMSTLFAALALFLSGIGLYGLLAANVSQRTSEIGVRMALGASRGQVVRMILSEALLILTLGLTTGAACLFYATRYGSGLLYGVSAFDAWRLAATAAVLTVTAIAAATIPAFRAASVDPVQALR